MIELKGNLFNSNALHIAHGVNRDGVMGAGIAKEFRAKFPDMFESYRKRCQSGWLTLGTTYTWVGPESDTGTERYVHNVVSQDRPGPEAKYTWLLTGLLEGVERAMAMEHYTMAIPRIGCGIGGLDWQNVQYLLHLIESDFPEFTFEVWSL